MRRYGFLIHEPYLANYTQAQLSRTHAAFQPFFAYKSYHSIQKIIKYLKRIDMKRSKQFNVKLRDISARILLRTLSI